MEFSLIRCFHDKIVSYSFTHSEAFVVKTSDMLIFFPLKNNSVTIGIYVLLNTISAIISRKTINTFLCQVIVLFVIFHKHHQFFVNIR